MASAKPFDPPERKADKISEGKPLGGKGHGPSDESVESTQLPSDDSDVEHNADADKVGVGGDDAWLEARMKDTRIAVIGNVDSGKSTLVGVLTKGGLDDGRGLARAKVFNFSHEAANGRTSSIAQEIMGFTERGDQVVADRPGAATAASRNVTWQQVVSQADRLVTFIDLCGHEKYLKTTIFGLVGQCPDYTMIIVNANAGFQRMSREHLGIALALRIPFFIVVTKIDIAPTNVFEENLSQLQKIVKSNAVKKIPVVLKDEADIPEAAAGLAAGTTCPMICISSVTGEGLPVLRALLRQLPSRLQDSGLFRTPSSPAAFYIDSIYNVLGVGLVAGGILRSGKIRCGQTLLLGPDKIGQFRPVLVKTIHYMRTNVDSVESGQHCSLALRSLVKKETLKKSMFRKGMVIVSPELHPKATWEFKAEVVILHHATTIREKYQAMVHCGIIRQCAFVKDMSCELLRSGDKAIVTFRWAFHAEYVNLGETLLFREGRTKGLGRIIEIVEQSHHT
jgi:GTPase